LRRGETIKIPKNDVQFVVTFPANSDPTQKEDTVSYPFMQFDTLEVMATDSLDVLLLLPFNAESSLKQTWLLEKNDKDPQIYSVSEKMVQFYEGVLLSIEDINMNGKHISLNVQDTKMNTSETSRILSDLKSVPDIIIGPVYNDNTKLCLEYGMKHNVNVLTSVLPNSDDLFMYPNLISVGSNHRINNDFVASYLINRDDNIVIVHDGSEKYSAIATQMKNDLQAYFKTQNVVGENEVKVFYFDKENQKSLKSFISEQDTNFVVSLSNNKIFVTSLMDALVVDHYDGNNVYVAISRGDIIKSHDGGNNWQTLKRFGDRIKKMVIDPVDSRIIYAVTTNKGVFQSVDGGLTWEVMETLNDMLLEEKLGIDIRDFLLIKNQPGTIFVTTYYGLLRSMDAGLTWENIKLILPTTKATINAIAVNPQNLNEIFYVTNTTFYRSNDWGQTWSTLQLPSTRAGMKLFINPVNPNVMYLGVK
jgi:hypothetical protein